MTAIYKGVCAVDMNLLIQAFVNAFAAAAFTLLEVMIAVGDFVHVPVCDAGIAHQFFGERAEASTASGRRCRHSIAGLIYVQLANTNH